MRSLLFYAPNGCFPIPQSMDYADSINDTHRDTELIHSDHSSSECVVMRDSSVYERQALHAVTIHLQIALPAV